MLSFEQALETVWKDPAYAEMVHNHYLDQDLFKAAQRFHRSAEFAEIVTLLEIYLSISESKVLDLGAGRGIASYAFANSGARLVYALEPDSSSIAGQGAIGRIKAGLPIEILDAFGENIPLPDGEVDLVYARQVLHHIQDLPSALRECARVLRPGGVFIACREHVVDNEQQLAAFLRSHPINQFTGEENAYRLHQYISAIREAGLQLEKVLATYDTIINAYPTAHNNEELRRLPQVMLERKLGRIGAAASFVPGINALFWKRLKRPVPGRGYSFLAIKPFSPN